MEGGKIPAIENQITAERVKKEGEELLAGFNFELQRNIIKSITEKCDISNPNLVTLRRIRNMDDPEAFGFYYPHTEREYIGINFAALLQEKTDPEKRKLFFWHLLNHEQLHAASAELEYGSMGYQSALGSFKMFNEGVTEMIARVVTREYYNANGHVSEPVPNTMYQVPVDFVELLIKKISSTVGVGEDIVREAIIRGFFERQRFLEEEFMELCSDVLPKSFARDLQWANSSDMKRAISSSNLVDLKLSPEQETQLETSVGNIGANYIRTLWDNSLSKH